MTTGRTRDLDLSQVTLSDPRAEAGSLLFSGDAKCSGCHANAGANFAGIGGNRNLNTGSEVVRLQAVDARDIARDGGFGGQGLPAVNFDADGDGSNNSYGNGTFNTPPLIEAADTAPFSRTNAFETLEQAVASYTTDTFANSPAGQILQGIQIDDQQIADVASFFRVLNAAFNLTTAKQRLAAALAIDAVRGKSRSQQHIGDRLVEFANVGRPGRQGSSR